MTPAESGARWLAAMRAGDFEAAWRITDSQEADRRRTGGAGPTNLLWDGTPLAGRHVLVRCLHGLGDTLQFARFFRAVRQRAGALTVLAQPDLLALLREHFPAIAFGNVFTDYEQRGEVELEVMELGYALRAQPGEQASAWANTWRPESEDVAVFWRASAWDDSRSVPLRELAPVFAAPRRFCSFQLDAPAAERAAFPGPSLASPHLEVLARRLARCARVLTVDGMSAHLAAAVGVPTGVLLKHDADWRWGAGPRSPWYPALRLFRQARPGDWASAVHAAARWIGQPFSASGAPEAARTV